MNVGVQFLREHMEPQARIHYAVTDGGGCSPNVVQSKASVLYMVRSPQVKKAVELQKRVDDIAAGAALMTGTTCERKFIDGVAETIPNHVLEALLYQNFAEVGVPQHTPEEKKAGIIVVGGAETNDKQYELIKGQFDCISGYLSWDLLFYNAYSATQTDDLANNESAIKELESLGSLLDSEK